MPDLSRPFTRADARVWGISDRRLAGPDFRRLFTGIYVSSRVSDSPSLRAQAALLAFRHAPEATATHGSCARVYGVPLPADALEHVTVADPAHRRTRAGIRCHLASLRADETRVVAGLRLSSPDRLFLELAESLDLVDLVVVGDWLVRWGWTSPEALVDAAAASPLPEAVLAREAASFVRRDVDSPMETRLRLLLVLAGLPEPQVNVRLRDENGTVVMRLDLSWPRVRLAVEYDGRQHLEDPDQWERDVDRKEELGNSWRLIRVTRKGIYDWPDRTVERVWRALRDRGWRGLRPPGDAWRPHFRASRKALRPAVAPPR